MEDIELSVDTSEVDHASSSAELAAQQANEAAAAATAAAINQAQIVSDVTAYAREDAQSAAAEANAAATVAENAANAASEFKELIVSEVQALLAPVLDRLNAVESRHSEPAVQQTIEPAVTEIDPNATEQGNQEELREEATGEAPAPARSRKRHGRRKR